VSQNDFLLLHPKKIVTRNLFVTMWRAAALRQKLHRRAPQYCQTTTYHTHAALYEHTSRHNGGEVNLLTRCHTLYQDKWSPALQIRTVLISIQALMSAPNPDDPLNNEAAERWKRNEKEALDMARSWNAEYAMK